MLTRGVNEGRVELLREKRVRHVSEKLLQQGGHIVNAMLFVQLHIDAAIKFFSQLRKGCKNANRKGGKGGI